MRVIDVEGLPEPIAQALMLLAQALRKQLSAEPKRRPRVKLPVHEGTILRPITRRDIYVNFR